MACYTYQSSYLFLSPLFSLTNYVIDLVARVFVIVCMCMCVSVCVCVCGLKQSPYYVGQAGLKLLDSSDPPASVS